MKRHIQGYDFHMSLSVFDLFKIGIGPSSSHTVGPMIAARRFAQQLPSHVTRVVCTLYGSLGATGIGHGTDRAVILGLMGENPSTVDPLSVDAAVQEVISSHRLDLVIGKGTTTIDFDPAADILMVSRSELPGHPNGMTFVAWNGSDELLAKTYYSVGGGFVVSADDADKDWAPTANLPYPFTSGGDLLEICEGTGMSIAEVAMANELAMRTENEIHDGLAEIWDVMQECVRNGCEREGVLPGGLQVMRRAPGMYASLLEDPSCANDPLQPMDWITLFALAVNEENAAGGRVVTAPTNGAAGIIPAVMHYCHEFVDGFDEAAVREFLLTAGAIGMVFKTMASISGAEVGCQGEVGSACSMAAAGLAAVLGGTPPQVENAAEIAMEHNLGLTCDPIAGLVQIPCIERNAIAAIKAVAAARTAMRGDGSHVVSLDDVITTMRETGKDMKSKYKETALGGLAVHVGVGVNVIEC